MKRKTLLGVLLLTTGLILLLLIATGAVFPQNSKPLNTPKDQPQITHIKLVQIAWYREGLIASAKVGYKDGDGKFVPLDTIEASWSRTVLQNQLTQAEKDALVSIRKKVRDALNAQYSGS